MSRRAFFLASICALVPACSGRVLPPTGQLLVYVNTDAPLPAAPGDVLGPEDPPPLFDRIRIEVFLPGEEQSCAGCTREFDVDRTFVGQGRASVGIVPPAGKTGYRARARMFRAAWKRGDEPNKDSTVDVTVALPPVEPDGITEVTVVLKTEDIAQRKGQDSPLPAMVGAPQPGLAGTWAPANRVKCNGSPQPGEVCIPGGAYWMGTTPIYENTFSDVAVQQRIVVLKPFFFAAHETTVAELRAAGVATAKDPTTKESDSSCTYSAKAGDGDDLPVTCITWQKARDYCQATGRDLPTEAQWEYVAGALASHYYPWGDDEPSCTDAIYGHNIMANGQALVGACNIFGGVRPGGSGKRDRVLMPGATEEILDVAGNAAEWTRDDWNDEAGGPCWSTGVVHDPFCAEPGPNKSKTLRGGGILEGRILMRAPARRAANAPLLSTGFRCTRPD